MVLLVDKNTAQDSRADAVNNIEKELENYWKWQVLLGKKKIKDLSSSDRKETFSNDQVKSSPKKIFSRILDVFKVSNAVNVVQDKNLFCDCDKIFWYLQVRIYTSLKQH